MIRIFDKIRLAKERVGLKFRIVFFATLALWAVFLSGIWAWSVFSNALVKKQLGRKALAVVNTASVHIERLGHYKIKTVADEKKTEYRAIVGTLRRIQSLNPFVRYIYTARIDKDSKMYFIVDPEENRDVNGDGVITSDEMRTRVGAPYGEPPGKYRECISAMSGTSEMSLDFVKDRWGEWISAAAPLRGPDGKIEAILAADISVNEVLSQQKQAKRFILLASFIGASVGGFFFALALGIFVTQPLKEMEMTARRIAEGNYSRALKLSGPAELGTLIKSFNNMRQRLFNERERIARDLHDGLIQIIRAAIFQVEYTARKPQEAVAELPKLKKTLDTAIEETRKIILELTPAKLIEKGLVPAMRHYAMKVKENAGIDYSFETNLPDNFSIMNEENIIKIYLETLNNVKFNSKASRFDVTFTASEKSGLRLAISDDGEGFDVEEALNVSGKYGIKNMMDRAQAADWKINISSGIGKGTSVILEMPRKSDV